MRTRRNFVRILESQPDKWKGKSATLYDTVNIGARNHVLMINKFRSILKRHGEKVVFSNMLVLDILDNYIEKSKEAKRLKRENAELKEELKKLRKTVNKFYATHG